MSLSYFFGIHCAMPSNVALFEIEMSEESFSTEHFDHPELRVSRLLWNTNTLSSPVLYFSLVDMYLMNQL